MSDSENWIASMRYPPAEEEMERLLAEKPVGDDEEGIPVEKALEQFWQRQKEVRYVRIPRRRKKQERFIRLAKELSKEFQIDMDIRKRPYFIEVDLHFYCAVYPERLARRFAQLFRLCDRFSSFVLSKEPWDFTLSLELDTHKCLL